MLYPRIIPCLLLHKKGLVKTVRFKDPKYVGDPLNAVRIFNEKEVDELMVIDIDASREGREPDYNLIQNLATECRMPLCYGGGIKTVDQAQRIFGLGVEKVALSSIIAEQPQIISKIAERVGAQSVLAIIDYKKKLIGNKHEVYTMNASHATNLDPISFAIKCEKFGAGEIVLNSIDWDGTMKGYDFSVIDKVRESISVPMTVMGGAGTLDHIGELISRHGIIGAAAGSLFVFKGKYKAVLINYPNRSEKQELLNKYFATFSQKSNN